MCAVPAEVQEVLTHMTQMNTVCEAAFLIGLEDCRHGTYNKDGDTAIAQAFFGPCNVLWARTYEE